MHTDRAMDNKRPILGETFLCPKNRTYIATEHDAIVRRLEYSTTREIPFIVHLQRPIYEKEAYHFFINIRVYYDRGLTISRLMATGNRLTTYFVLHVRL